MRYDPVYQNDVRTQDLRITLHEFPIFWRIDLLVTSDRRSPQKYPSPFPKWSIATSAFWNLVWAVKYGKRGKPDVASDHTAAACTKLQIDGMSFSYNNVRSLLVVLMDTHDVDGELVTKLRNELPASP